MRSIIVIALSAIMCLSLCLLASCGNKGETGKKGDGNETMKQYTIALEKQSPFGEVNAEAKKSQDGGTLYEFVVTPKFGYSVKSFKINGTEFQLKDNKFECILQQDVTVGVEYQRKTNEELESRRETVLKKMRQITGTQFKYDRDYDYLINKKDTHINGGTIYQGMPYANNPTLNYDAFIEDFTTGPDANGVYTVKDILAYDKYIWGNNCADVVYWSWATIANSFDNITFSGYFLEKYDLVHVGDYDVLEEEINKDRPHETIEICKRNGMQKMFEAYAMLMKGDGLMFYHPTGGHVIMAAEVKLARTAEGTIDGERSKLVYYDQNSGYSQKQGINNRTVWSSCAYQGTMTFTQLYTDGYLPITCKELMDESIEIEAETVTDSLTKEQLTKINVLRGFIDSNYYISKAKMEITDANGNVVYSGIRYRDETKPYRMSMSWFTEKTTPSYSGMDIYKPFSLDELAAGNYHCKVDVYLSTGSVHTVRDFEFVN